MPPIIAVAPMMDCTDKHDRYFLRLLAPHAQLYTEMITSYALLHGDVKHLLSFHPTEKYLALQLGGSSPKDLAYSAKLGENFGYDEINLNIGCPSERVKNGRFGACLMREPELVAECVSTMQAHVKIPVTVKCRIGVDEQDSEEELHHFITLIQNAGCKKIIIHARKAWLSGLSPKENREIPPLRYDVVKRVKEKFPQLAIILNGGIKKLTDINTHLEIFDGVMIGREAYANPYFLAEIEKQLFNTDILSRSAVIQALLPYIRQELKKGVRLANITRHLLGLFQGQRGARQWRRYLSEHAHRALANTQVVEEALACVGGNSG